jgi:VanZ family protein
LFFLVARGVNWDKAQKNWWLPAVITIFYALTDEYHQSFVAGRTALPSDVVYDSIGVMITYMRINKFI